MADDAGEQVKVWDLPTRLVHWVIVALVPFSFWAVKSDHLAWHRLSGYTIIALLVSRLIWGVVGGETARFARFVVGPRRALAYLTGRVKHGLGHNPLGGWSIVAMLADLTLQVTLGLFAVDEDGLDPSPLAKFVDFDTGRLIARIHELNFYVLLALITLHLGAVAFYTARGKNLVGPMITGRARNTAGAPAPRLAAPWLWPLAALAGAAVSWVLAHGLKLS